jgi:SAM-dependent MidA family methyltransferase
LNTAAEQIRAEIEEQGAISFARFMEVALYCPLCGYYEKKEDTPGQRGDFYTSVSVGPLFGELLAFQFAEWFSQFDERNPRSGTDVWQLIEAGAHDGRLARDVLNWFQLRRPALFERIEYVIVEPSPRRREWQRETLAMFGSKVVWSESLREPPAVNPRPTLHTPRYTIIFSNELLDAFPVHRLGWDARKKTWFEWGVASQGDRFVWHRLTEIIHHPPFTTHFPSELGNILPDGFTTEICPAAEAWWREAASALKHGKVMTLDYGLSAEEYFSPQRADGTLRAYRRHQLADDLLAHPGERDLTAHVNFTEIQRAGEERNLKTESFVSQTQFLTGVAQNAWKAGNNFGPWTHEHTRQFQTLTHPNHLGRAFRVLVQSRDECSS